MIDKIIDYIPLSKRERLAYILLCILWIAMIPPLPEWMPWVSLSSLFPRLDTEKTTILLSLSIVLLIWSSYLLRVDKNEEIKKLESELNSHQLQAKQDIEILEESHNKEITNLQNLHQAESVNYIQQIKSLKEKPKHKSCPKCLEPAFKFTGKLQPHPNDFFANSGVMLRVYKCDNCGHTEARGN